MCVAVIAVFVSCLCVVVVLIRSSRFCVLCAPMQLTQLPRTVLVCHLLDFLPAGAAWMLLAVSHFAELTVECILSYISSMKADLLERLDPLLYFGIAIPVFEYRAGPTVLLRCPVFNRAPPVERLGTLAFNLLGLPPQAPDAFELFLARFDSFMEEARQSMWVNILCVDKAFLAWRICC